MKYNEARYGRNGYPVRRERLHNTWALVRDAANQWVADQMAAGRTDAEIKADLAVVRPWDRYDFDGDGNFNEPDGYIDHFQIVHAGGDQADGDPIQGEDAIWSHRWYAFATTTASPARPTSRSAAPRSATPVSGSATTPSSRRTVAGASSTTSTVTTWVCRTTTTSSVAATTTTSTGP